MERHLGYRNNFQSYFSVSQACAYREHSEKSSNNNNHRRIWPSCFQMKAPTATPTVSASLNRSHQERPRIIHIYPSIKCKATRQTEERKS